MTKLGHFKMINIEDKTTTRRRALATGLFIADPKTIATILERRLPKGDAIQLAEVAGIQAAKITSQILPLCHPLALDSVRVWCESEGTESIRFYCEANTSAKTGVEMEALQGVQSALLCVYDLTKGIDPVLKISEIKLLEKVGGKSGHWVNPESKLSEVKKENLHRFEYKKLRFSVLTLSDRASKGIYQDLSGELLKDHFIGLGAQIVQKKVVSDEQVEIEKILDVWLSDSAPDLILLTGGTGIGPRDVTIEAMHSIADRLNGKVIPGFGEKFRRESAHQTESAWLSRCEAVVIRNSMLLSLPGSVNGVTQGIHSFSSLIPHALMMIRGGGH